MGLGLEPPPQQVSLPPSGSRLRFGTYWDLGWGVVFDYVAAREEEKPKPNHLSGSVEQAAAAWGDRKGLRAEVGEDAPHSSSPCSWDTCVFLGILPAVL